MANTRIMLNNVRISYPHLFEPYGMDGSPEKYSAAFLIPKTDRKNVEKVKAAIEAAIEDGKAKKKKGFDKKNLWYPLQDGDDKDDPSYHDHWYINAKSDKKPGVVDQQVVKILDPDAVYAGCIVNATVNFYPFSTNGNAGVGAGLGNIQFVKDGERLDGGASAESEFGVIEDDDDDIFN